VRDVRNTLRRAIRKVRGLIIFEQRIVYVDPELHPSKVAFTTFHEVAHKILPTHSQLASPHCDDDLSLSPEVTRSLEIEANIAASLILFQVDRFADELADSPVGAGYVLQAAKRYGSSYHSAFRKYVETHAKRCALLVLEPHVDRLNPESLKLRYFVESPSFERQFGRVNWSEYLQGDSPLIETVNQNVVAPIKEGTLNLIDIKQFKVELKVEVFSNHYNTFVLCYPNRKGRTHGRLVVANSLDCLRPSSTS
jgi:hypothetical protein